MWEERNPEVRAFLEGQYGGKCQICQAPPFLKRDGQPYLTGVSLVSRTKARWLDRPGNNLCLRATCCAQLLHGPVEAHNILDQIRTCQPSERDDETAYELQITLCDKPATIRFSERHMIDLQELLKAGSAVGAAEATGG